MLQPIKEKQLIINNDTRILATAIDYENLFPDEMIFFTNDLLLKNIANLFFGEDSIKSITDSYDNYKGYKEVVLDDEEMSNFYLNQDKNLYNLLINQYLIIKDKNNEIVDK